jgi:hypothetical protein
MLSFSNPGQESCSFVWEGFFPLFPRIFLPWAYFPYREVIAGEKTAEEKRIILGKGDKNEEEYGNALAL